MSSAKHEYGCSKPQTFCISSDGWTAVASQQPEQGGGSAHLSSAANLSIAACCWSDVSCVRCSKSLSSCRWSRVPASSPRTSCNCPSSNCARCSEFLLSISLWWSFSSRSITETHRQENIRILLKHYSSHLPQSCRLDLIKASPWNVQTTFGETFLKVCKTQWLSVDNS